MMSRLNNPAGSSNFGDGTVVKIKSTLSPDLINSMESSLVYSQLNEDECMTLLDLPWEQVLCKHMLVYLSIADLFRFRAASCGCRDLVHTYFRLQFHINTSSLGDHFTPQAFRIMTQDCTSLKSISVRGAKSWLTTNAMLDVISANPRIEKIDLTGCLALSGATLYSIGVNCGYIKHLCLKDCVWLSVDNFLSFLCNHHDLEYLDLSGCWNLDDDLVIQLIQVSPSIRHLLLANLYGLTDRAVGAVAHCCPNLVHLSIRGCWRVTDSSIKMLSQYCPNLKAIQVQECRDITEDSLGYLRMKRVMIDKAPPQGNHLYRLEQQMSNLRRLNLVFNSRIFARYYIIQCLDLLMRHR